MSFGFGKNSGPGNPPSGGTPFSHFSRPPSLQTSISPFPDPTIAPRFPSPRPFNAVARSPNPQPSTSPFPDPLGASRFPSPRPFEAVGRLPSPQPSTSTFPDPSGGPRYPSPRASSLRWDRKSSMTGGFGNPSQKRSSPDIRTNVSSKVSRSQDLERSRPPPVHYTDDFLKDPNGDALERASSLRWDRPNLMSGGFSNPNQKRSPPDLGTHISFKVSRSQDIERSRPPPVQYTDDFLKDPDSDIMERPALHTHAWGAAAKPGNRSTNLFNERSISPAKTVETWKPKDLSSEDEIKRSSNVFRGASRRPSLSPPKSRGGMGVIGTPDSQFIQRVSPSADKMNGDPIVTSLVSHSTSKRTRSPPAATSQIIQMNSNSIENDAEREQQAKAKRLARFRVELDEVELTNSIQHIPNATQNKVPSMKTDRSGLENNKFFGDHTSGSMEDLSQDFDNEHLQSRSIIVGLCPDMCPVSERGERERKGDLDRYERLDGDRNRTNKALAVKKYNRTAEREAELIRPMPILQKTMDYLLGLLEQPYDDRFLGLYNFLWDRMRAIRMDLRMQHIFNLKSIAMLEQMIRLHIIAMHELCEFSKGEGFSEGFDAHLNIEQMNKTSVELFQIYDDHRKKGIFIPTEKEFRGYYALLKLDKHPGYKVEPAELSLDLAKMTSEIRQTQEILLARDVARSCRTGNFIAFFRHARKASYLQACLMHAHFSKLRTQALASLHSGLQYNQGLPVTHAAKWLGMEEEDIESLLEYHGFSIKEFGEPYMVKDGPFLNDDKDYPTRCSILVHRKKSDTIMEDVLSSHQVILPSVSRMEPLSEVNGKTKRTAGHPVQAKNLLNVSVDAVMQINSAVLSPRGSIEVQPVVEPSSGVQVWQLPEPIIDQPSKMNTQRVSLGSPRTNTKRPNAFASSENRSMQEWPSPVTPKDSLHKVGDGQLSRKSSPRNFLAEQFVPAPQTSSLGLARQDDFRGPIQSSDIVADTELKAAQPAVVSANVSELIPSHSKATFNDATSRQDNIFMVELSGKEFTDSQQKAENDDAVSNYDDEVAEAKLRLLIRLWRRRSIRKKEFREQNRLAANAALSSLCLGPPVRQRQDKHAPCRKLNIDRAVHERYEKWKQSRVRWNVADLLAGKLAEKTANSKCVCWKVVLFSRLHQRSCDTETRISMTHLSLDEWLRYKLIPADKDGTVEGLAMSAPGLSVWRKWVHNHSGDIACHFSVIKDTEDGNSEKQVSGASAVLFPISETVPWDLQRAQLHKLVMSLPAGACISLLILSGSDEDQFADFSDGIVDKLGLKDLDKSRVGSFQLVFLNEREETSQVHGFFSDKKLKDGLMWLASESRPQPALNCVTMRELVSLHLNSCLDALDLLDSNKACPNKCISAFNKALDQSVSDIVTAARANPTCWPCPDVFLLDDATAEFRAVKQFLPSLGWSSSEEIEPLVTALRNCKLPYFSDDLSWLDRGCNTEKDIEDQTQLLQDRLVRYLTQLSNVMYSTLAAKEASLMVQSCTGLELHDTQYKMVPSWLPMFRRVFNWQLNSSAIFANKAYVLELFHSSCNSLYLDKSELEVPTTPHYTVRPSFDEMVEISCSPIASKRVRSSPKSFQTAAAITSGENATEIIPSLERNQCSQILVPSVDDSYIRLVESDGHLVHKDTSEADRLVKLLDQCNILQDENQRKLSLYF